MASRIICRGKLQQKGPNTKATTPSLMGHNHSPPLSKPRKTTLSSLSNPKIYLSSQNSLQILHPSQIQVKIQSQTSILHLFKISSLFFLNGTNPKVEDE
jgi:hypothetical protein